MKALQKAVKGLDLVALHRLVRELMTEMTK